MNCEDSGQPKAEFVTAFETLSGSLFESPPIAFRKRIPEVATLDDYSGCHEKYQEQWSSILRYCTSCTKLSILVPMNLGEFAVLDSR
jgi:hypothetical protein